MLQRLLRQDRAHDETDAKSVQMLRHDPAVQIIDVREPDEWRAGHLREASLIPLGLLANRKDELDATLLVIAVCRSGARSLVAVDVLRQHGFTNVKSMAGGMLAWSEAGYPINR